MPQHEEIVKYGISQLLKDAGDMRDQLVWSCQTGRHNLAEVLLIHNATGYGIRQHIDGKTDQEDDHMSFQEDGCECPRPKGGWPDVFPYDNPVSDAQEPRYRVAKHRSAIDVLAAVAHNRTDIVKLLLEYGALLEVRDEEMYTPLGIAARDGLGDVIDVLLAHSGITADIVDSIERR